jgi:hypothetical protein
MCLTAFLAWLVLYCYGTMIVALSPQLALLSFMISFYSLLFFINPGIPSSQQFLISDASIEIKLQLCT